MIWWWVKTAPLKVWTMPRFAPRMLSLLRSKDIDADEQGCIAVSQLSFYW